MDGQSGGAVAKVLGLVLVLALLASAALYVYGSRQQPLAIGDLTAAKANIGRDGSSVTLDDNGSVAFATIVRNDGRLPVTLEGVAAPTGKPEPLLVTSIGLGDGSDASAAAVFTPSSLDPGTGIGIVLVIGANPAYPCERLSADPNVATPLPPIALRFSSYGVTGTQTLPITDAPDVVGLTRRVCSAAAAP